MEKERYTLDISSTKLPDCENILSKKLLNYLDLENITLENLDNIIYLFSSSFINLFKNIGFLLYHPVPISSKVDNTVYLVGSPSNTLKYYIKGEKLLPNKGFVISQPCFRAHNIKKLFTNEKPEWWSTFIELTALCKLDYWEETLQLVLKYFYNLWFRKEDIKIQVLSEDKEFIHYLSKNEDLQIEYDKYNLNYYRHKYWEKNIFWKNFNFQLRKKGTNNFYDVGNFIIIYQDNKKHLIELALGLNIIIQMRYGLDHVIDTFPISYLLPIWNINIDDTRKLQDSITSFIILYKEWIRVKASDTRWRIIRTYLNGIYFYTKKLWLEFEKLFNILTALQKFYGLYDKTFLLYIEHYFEKLENKLIKEKKLNKEEKAIKNLLQIYHFSPEI